MSKLAWKVSSISPVGFAMHGSQDYQSVHLVGFSLVDMDTDEIKHEVILRGMHDQAVDAVYDALGKLDKLIVDCKAMDEKIPLDLSPLAFTAITAMLTGELGNVEVRLSPSEDPSTVDSTTDTSGAVDTASASGDVVTH